MRKLPHPWRQMTENDLAWVAAIAPLLRKRPMPASLPANRFRLCPNAALIAEVDGDRAAYLLAHPWIEGWPPDFEAEPTRLPAAATCLFIHDMGVEPRYRGLGLARTMLTNLPAIARAANLPAIELVAAPPARAFFRRNNFLVRPLPAAHLLSSDAKPAVEVVRRSRSWFRPRLSGLQAAKSGYLGTLETHGRGARLMRWDF